MENFEKIVKRNHDERTAAVSDKKWRKIIARIALPFLIVVSTFAAFMLDLMHIYLAAPVMFAAYTVACIRLGRFVRLVIPRP